ncbi:MAG: hypothetical protein K2M43_02120 [Mycoplasmoidaceae bacterium]|nr:hypothetical protein [Mycoplasmoidaceae bacterium]
MYVYAMDINGNESDRINFTFIYGAETSCVLVYGSSPDNFSIDSYSNSGYSRTSLAVYQNSEEVPFENLWYFVKDEQGRSQEDVFVQMVTYVDEQQYPVTIPTIC